MHGKGLSLSSPFCYSPSVASCDAYSHTALGGFMDAKVELRQQFHTYRQVQKTKKGRRPTKTKRRLSKIAYKAGTVSLLETLVAAQRIGQGSLKKPCLQTLFPPMARHDTPMTKSPHGDRSKTRHASVPSGGAVSPTRLRWASGMYPDLTFLTSTAIL
jgi:hypothetical protein